MAWTTPSAFSSGDPLTLTLANQYMVDNPQFLYDNLGILDAKIGHSLLGSAGTFSFTSIPASYDHLLIYAYLRSDRTDAVTDTLLMRFNNDSGSNYIYSIIQNVTATVTGVSGSGQSSLFGAGLNIQDSHATPGTLAFTALQIVIPNYANATNYKSAIVHGGYYQGASGASGGINVGHGVWRGTPAAISRIDLAPGSGTNFQAGSMVSIFAAQSI